MVDFALDGEPESPGTVVTDLSLAQEAPFETHPQLVIVDIALHDLRENGFPTPDESDRMFAMESALGDALMERADAVYPGRVLTNGSVFFHYYLPTGVDAEKVVDEVMVGFPDYKAHIKRERDPEWGTYFEILFPPEEELQRQGDLQVIGNLQKHGDTLTTPRKVEHYVDFTDPDSQSAFEAEATKLGYAIDMTGEAPAHDHDHAHGEQCDHDHDHDPQFTTRISRTDAVDEESITEITTLLFRLARECGGDYNGWETMVIRDGKPVADSDA
jgi:uncharacterized protein (TIGR01619 family)